MKIIKFVLFNPLSNSYLSLKTNSRFLFFLTSRLKLMTIDYLYLLSVFIPFFIIAFLLFIIASSQNMGNSNSLRYLIYFLFMGFFIALLNKDFYNGRSVAKRILGYQLLDYKTKLIATEFQCAIRNITCIIWPLEFIISLINPQRRIGDLIAGTILKESEPISAESILLDIREKTLNSNSYQAILLSVLVGLLFAIIIKMVEYIIYL